MPRRSKRLAKGEGGADPGDSDNEGTNRRASIGDALGLQTPNKLKGANLREARANEVAEAAVRRLDSLRPPSRARKSKKKKKKKRKGQRAREVARRASLALLKQTKAPSVKSSPCRSAKTRFTVRTHRKPLLKKSHTSSRAWSWLAKPPSDALR